jgi:hypothetical protein
LPPTQRSLEIAMGDVVFVLIALGFFAAMGLYALFCERQ